MWTSSSKFHPIPNLSTRSFAFRSIQVKHPTGLIELSAPPLFSVLKVAFKDHMAVGNGQRKHCTSLENNSRGLKNMVQSQAAEEEDY